MDREPVVIIYNPVSGSGRSSRLAAGAEQALAARGLATRLEPTRRAGDGTAIAEGYENRCRALLAVGGDGTVREVIQGMAGTGAPLAILPAGTANVLAAELRLPADPAGVAGTIAGGHRRLLDRFELESEREGARRGLLFVGVGCDGTVVHRLDHRRRANLERGGSGHITKLHYLRPILHAARTLPRPDLEVTVDNVPLAGGPWGWVLITNVTHYGGLMHLGPKIRPDDGRLDLLAFRAGSLLALARYGLAGWLDLLPRLRDVTHHPVQSKVVVRGGKDRPVQLDGDPAGFSPLTVRRLDSRVPILVPPPPPTQGDRP